ncbi:30S ribosomal protein S17 [Candidatus Dependentiae bacterium]|nr:MAG: 30S ribosomal protein S17 [Candidatus Dependentiae bacterium]
MGTVKRAKQKRFFEGYVVSDKMEKTIVVKVQRTFKHPLLGKIIRRSKRYKVHDELMHAKDGDFVKIVETRSLSKTKHMRLVEIMRSVRQGA